MPLPILYSFRRCPYAMRARAAIIASGIRVELREVELRNKPAAILAASPKGSVPVLVLTDGQVIDESWDIMLWALRQHDPQTWLGPHEWLGMNECHVQVALPWVNENDTTFKRNLDRYKYPERFPEQPQSAYRAAGEQFLQQLEQQLLIPRNSKQISVRSEPVEAQESVHISTRSMRTDSLIQHAGSMVATPCLLGATFTLADAALLPFVRQFAAVDAEWFATAPYPVLRAWLASYISSELFALVMQKFPMWQPGDEPIIFGK